MRRAEGIVFALAPLGEAAKAAALAQSADAIPPSGQDLVRIALVADIPDEFVLGRIEHVMNRHGQFDHAEARAEMPAAGADRIDHLAAQFVGQLAKLVLLELAKVGGKIDSVEQGGLGR